MKKIILSKEQICALEKHFSGKHCPFLASKEERKAMMEVIDMADELMEELDAYDELNGDLMLWFWNKYNEQKEE